MSSSSANMPVQYPCCALSNNKQNTQFIPPEDIRLKSLMPSAFNVNNIRLESKMSQILKLQAEVISNVLNRLKNEITIMGQWYSLLSKNSTELNKFLSDFEINLIRAIFPEDLSITEESKHNWNDEVEEDFKQCFHMIFSNEMLVNYLNNSSLKPESHIVTTIIQLIETTIVLYKRDICMSFANVEKEKNMVKAFNEKNHLRWLRLKKLAIEKDETQKVHDEYHEEKSDQNNRILEKIRLLRCSLKDEFDNLIKYTKNNIFVLKTKSDQRMHLSEQIADASKRQLKRLLNENITEETHLRERKRKLDLQLGQWIEKYDKAMQERQTELEIHIEKYEKASKEYEELSVIMKNHEVIYDKYFVEKTNEERKIFEEKLYSLMSTRAAKVLQRAWRANRAHQKRKKRKGKKGKSKK